MATQTEKLAYLIDVQLRGDAAFVEMRRELEQLRNAAARTNTSNRNMSQGFTQAARASQNAAAGLGRYQGLFQNLSYQVTDFTVQMQGGVAATRAFSQQMPQVAGALGAAGIGGAFGVVALAIGSVVAAMAPAIIQFIKGKDTADQFAESLKKISDNEITFSDMAGDIDKAADDMKRLNGDTAELFQTLQRMQQTKAVESFREMQDASRRMAEGLSDDADKNIRSVEKWNNGLQQMSVDTTGRLSEQYEVLRRQAPALEELSRLVDEVSDKSLTNISDSMFVSLFTQIEQVRTQFPSLREDMDALQDLMTQLRQGSVAVNFTLPEVDPKTVDNVEKLATEWQRFLDAVKSDDTKLGEQVDRIRELGRELGKTPDEINRLAEAFIKLNTAIEPEKLTPFAEGVESARQSINALVTDAEKLAGIQSVLAEFNPGTDEWETLTRLLGDSADASDRVRLAWEDMQTSAETINEMKEAVEQLAADMGLTAEETEKLAEKLGLLEKQTENINAIGVAIGGVLKDGVQDLIGTIGTSEQSFKDWAKNAVASIGRVIAEVLALQAIQNAANAAGYGDFFGFAKGGVFDQFKIQPGVYNQPTFFPMQDAGFHKFAAGGVGVFAEQGAEAIMPLSRNSSGELGVKSEVNVNVTNNAGAQVDVRQDGNDIEIVINRVAADIMRGGTRMARAFENTYGMSRARGSTL